MAAWVALTVLASIGAVADTLPQCTEGELDRWTFVVTEMHGAVGVDAAGGRIGGSAAGRLEPFVGSNWFPADTWKQTLCGRVDHFIYTDIVLSREYDWNLFVVPASSFAHIIDDVRVFARAGAVHRCGSDGSRCLEVEATPDAALRSNAWFSVPADGSPALVGRDVCAYGPWVWELVHGSRPEFHPSELLWWRDLGGLAAPLYVAVVADDSGRFSKEDQLSPPAQPWAGTPRRETVEVAYEVPTAGEPLELVLDVLESCGAEAAHDGLDHPYPADGPTLVRVTEPGPADQVEVSITPPCAHPDRPALLGYVRLSAAVKSADGCRSGFQLLRLAPQAVSFPTPTPSPAAEPLIVARPTSVRRGMVDGAPAWLATYRLELPGVVPERAIELERRLRVALEARPSLMPRPNLRLQLRSEEAPPAIEIADLEVGSRQATVPALTPDLEPRSLQASAGIVAVPFEVRLAPRSSDPGAMEAFLLAAGVESERQAGALEQGRRAELQVEVAISQAVDVRGFYSPIRDGEVMGEERSPITDMLNLELERPLWEAKALGSELRFDWQFEQARAEDLTLRKEMQPVRATRPQSADVCYRVLDRTGPASEAIDVFWPSSPDLARHVFTFEIPVVVRDPAVARESVVYVQQASATITVWPKGVRQRLLPLVAAAAGVPLEPLLEAIDDQSAKDPVELARDHARRRARLTFLYAGAAARDGRIDPWEFAHLMTLARRSSGAS